MTRKGLRTDIKTTRPSDEPGSGPQEVTARRTDEDDVEGHNMLPNAMLNRSLAQSRERDIQRNMKQHDLKSEARRPFHKER
jgi:hypothetical protein